jgi:Mg-chelatase subunit ChlD
MIRPSMPLHLSLSLHPHTHTRTPGRTDTGTPPHPPIPAVRFRCFLSRETTCQAFIKRATPLPRQSKSTPFSTQHDNKSTRQIKIDSTHRNTTMSTLNAAVECTKDQFVMLIAQKQAELPDAPEITARTLRADIARLQSDVRHLELGGAVNVPEDDQCSEQWVEVAASATMFTNAPVATSTNVTISLVDTDDDLEATSSDDDTKDPAEFINFKRLLFDLRKHKQSSLSYEGQSCRMVFGYTGSGKTTFVNYANGREIKECRLDTPNKRGRGKKVLDIKEGFSPLEGFEIGHSLAKSKTYYLRAWQDDERVFWCDTPGFAESKGVDVAVAHAIAMASALNKCKGVLPILLINYKDIDHLKAKAVKELFDLFSKFIVSDFEINIQKVQILYTHVPSGVETDDILLMLDEVKLEREGSGKDTRLIAHAITLLEQHGDLLILRPHEKRPDDLLKLLSKAPVVTNCADAFGAPLSDQERHYLTAACDRYVENTLRQLKGQSFNGVLGYLRDLKLVVDDSRLPTVKRSYDKLVNEILDVFLAKLQSASKAMDAYRFDQVRDCIAAVSDDVIEYFSEMDALRETDYGYQTVAEKLDRLVDRIRDHVEEWKFDSQQYFAERQNVLEVSPDFGKVGENLTRLQALVSALGSNMSSKDGESYIHSVLGLEQFLQHSSKLAKEQIKQHKYGTDGKPPHLNYLLTASKDACTNATPHLNPATQSLYDNLRARLQKSINGLAKEFSSGLGACFEQKCTTDESRRRLADILSCLKAAQNCLHTHTDSKSYDAIIASLKEQGSAYGQCAREALLKREPGEYAEVKCCLDKFRLLADLIADDAAHSQFTAVQKEVWLNGKSMAIEINELLLNRDFTPAAKHLGLLQSLCNTLAVPLDAVKTCAGGTLEDEETEDQQSNQDSFVDLPSWLAEKKEHLSLVFIEACDRATELMDDNALKELSKDLEGVQLMWAMRVSFSKEAQTRFRQLGNTYRSNCCHLLEEGGQVVQSLLGSRLDAAMSSTICMQDLATLIATLKAHNEHLLTNKTLACFLGAAGCERLSEGVEKTRQDLFDAVTRNVEGRSTIFTESMDGVASKTSTFLSTTGVAAVVSTMVLEETREKFATAKSHLDVLQGMQMHLDGLLDDAKHIPSVIASLKTKVDSTLTNLNSAFLQCIANEQIDKAEVIHQQVRDMQAYNLGVDRVSGVVQQQTVALDAKKSDFVQTCQTHLDNDNFIDLGKLLNGREGWKTGPHEQSLQWFDAIKKIKHRLRVTRKRAMQYLNAIIRDRGNRFDIGVFEDKALPLYTLLSGMAESPTLLKHIDGIDGYDDTMEKLKTAHTKVVRKIGRSASSKLMSYNFAKVLDCQDDLSCLIRVDIDELAKVAEVGYDKLKDEMDKLMSDSGLLAELGSLLWWVRYSEDTSESEAEEGGEFVYGGYSTDQVLATISGAPNSRIIKEGSLSNKGIRSLLQLNNKPHGGKREELVNRLRALLTDTKEDLDDLSDAASKKSECSFQVVVEPREIYALFAGLKEASRSESFVDSKKELEKHIAKLKDALSTKTDAMYEDAVNYAKNGYKIKAEKLYREYSNLQSNCPEYTPLVEADVKSLRCDLDTECAVSLRFIVKYPDEGKLKIKEKYASRDRHAFKNHMEAVIDPVQDAHRSILSSIDSLNVDAATPLVTDVVAHLKRCEALCVAYQGIHFEKVEVLREMFDMILGRFKEKLRHFVASLATAGVTPRLNAAGPPRGLQRQNSFTLEPLQAKAKLCTFVNSVTDKLRSTKRPTFVDLANEYEEQIKPINSELVEAMDEAKTGWKYIEDFDILSAVPAMKDVSDYVNILRQNRAFHAQQSRAVSEDISYDNAIATIQEEVKRQYVFYGDKLFGEDDKGLKSQLVMLENLRTLANCLPEIKAGQVVATFENQYTEWFEHFEREIAEQYKHLLDPDTLHDEEEKYIQFNQIDKRCQQMRHVHDCLRPFVPHLESQVDVQVLDMVHQKFKDFNSAKDFNLDTVAELLVSVFDIASKMSSLEVKSKIEADMDILMNSLNRKNQLDITHLAAHLQGDIGGAAGNEIVNSGKFNIFQNVWNQKFQEVTSGMTFMKALEELKVLNPKITGEFSKDAEGKVTGLAPMNAQLNHLFGAWERYEHTINATLKTSISGNPRPVYQRLRHRFATCQREQQLPLEEVPDILAYISAAVALELSTADTDKTSMRKPHPVQMLALFRLLGVDKDPHKTKFLFFDSQRAYKLENHLIQVSTGEGKSIILGILSIFLASLGSHVDCVCYSEYLSERDYKSFETVFNKLGIGDKVRYSTFGRLCNRNIIAEGDIRVGARGLLEGSLKAGDVHNRTAPSSNRVLLIDEVDVFFSDHFYGATWNPVAPIRSKAVTQLLQHIWNTRGSKLNFEAVSASKAYEAVANMHWRGRKQEATIKHVFTTEIEKMIRCTTTFDSVPHVIAKDEHHETNIGIDDHGTVNFDLECGYNTTWWFFRARENGAITQTTFDNSHSVGLSVNCGQFSYAEMPKKYSNVLGVTGTLEALGDYERSIIKDEYKIKKQTIMPSLYGKRDSGFNKGVQCEASKDDYHLRILTEIDQMRRSERAVLVFFENEARLREWMASENGGKRFRKDVINVVTSGKDVGHYVSKATRKGEVTLFPRVFGRGLDFQVFDPKVSGNGGVHVIQTFLSEEKTEEIQIMGRTCRQGSNGSYKMILLEDDLLRWSELKNPDAPTDPLLTEAELKTPNAELYGLLDTRRQAWFSQLSEKRSKKVQRASQDHQEAMRFQHDLSLATADGNARDRCFQFLTQQTRVCSVGVNYHIIFCVDRSGSMSGGKWRSLKQAYGSFLDTISSPLSDHRVSLILFNTEAIGQNEDASLPLLANVTDAKACHLPDPTGGTRFAPPLDKALAYLRQGRQSNANLKPLVVFMSDGQNSDKPATSNSLGAIKSELPASHFIYFGADAGQENLQRVAAEIGGDFHTSVDGIALEATFTEIAQGISQNR